MRSSCCRFTMQCIFNEMSHFHSVFPQTARAVAHALSSALQCLALPRQSHHGTDKHHPKSGCGNPRGLRNVEDREATITQDRAISPQAPCSPLSEDKTSSYVPNKTLGGSTSQSATTSMTLAPGSCTQRDIPSMALQSLFPPLVPKRMQTRRTRWRRLLLLGATIFLFLYLKHPHFMVISCCIQGPQSFH